MQLAGPSARPSGHPDLALILPNLFVGEYPTPTDAAWLRTQGITAVLSLQDDVDLARKGLDLEILEEAYDRAGLRFARIPIADGDLPAFSRLLDSALALLQELLAGDGRVYLHCNAGLNRAPTLAVAYMHTIIGQPLEAACAFVKRRRPCVPYMTFLRSRYAA